MPASTDVSLPCSLFPGLVDRSLGVCAFAFCVGKAARTVRQQAGFVQTPLLELEPYPALLSRCLGQRLGQNVGEHYILPDKFFSIINKSTSTDVPPLLCVLPACLPLVFFSQSSIVSPLCFAVLVLKPPYPMSLPSFPPAHGPDLGFMRFWPSTVLFLVQKDALTNTKKGRKKLRPSRICRLKALILW